MLSNSHGKGQFGEPVAQPSNCSLFQWTQVCRESVCLRVVPLVEFRNQLKQPCQSIGTLEAGAPLCPQIASFLFNIVCAQAWAQSLACRRREGSSRKGPD